MRVMQRSWLRHQRIIFKAHDHGGKYTEATMLQYMQSQPAPSTCPCTLDLYGYNALIHLGCVASPERFELATHAVNKTSRFWWGKIQLVVAIDDGRMQQWVDMPANCSFHAPDRLQDVIDDYRRFGSLLIPDQNDSAGDAVLHALASGVPLDALNFHARPGGKVMPRHGDAFLAFGSHDRSN
jgi:hypothetical protein